MIADKDIPQVWLIKHNLNGNSSPNVTHNQSYAESDLFDSTLIQ